MSVLVACVAAFVLIVLAMLISRCLFAGLPPGFPIAPMYPLTPPPPRDRPTDR